MGLRARPGQLAAAPVRGGAAGRPVGRDRALWHTTDNFSERYYLAVNIEDLLYVVPFVALLPLIWRRVGKPYAVFTAVALAVPMAWPASTGDFPLFSMPRFTILAFPGFIAAAVLGERPWVHTTIVAASSAAPRRRRRPVDVRGARVERRAAPRRPRRRGSAPS